MQDKLDQEQLGKIILDMFLSTRLLFYFCVSLCVQLFAVFHSGASPRLDWFVFENVPEYPTDYLAPLEQKYAYEETLISPQRFGKPMNRPRLPKPIHACVIKRYIPHLLLWTCIYIKTYIHVIAEKNPPGCASIGSTITRRSIFGRALACGKYWSWCAHFPNSTWMLIRCIGCCLQNWHIAIFYFVLLLLYAFGYMHLKPTSVIWSSANLIN